MTDAFAENPLITSVVVNPPEDPLDITSDCGNVRYNESWYGKIDEFGAWNRILTSQEITDLYNNY